MMKTKSFKYITAISLVLALPALVGWGSMDGLFSGLTNHATFLRHVKPATGSWMEREISVIRAQASNLDERVLRIALTAYVKARQRGMDNRQVLTIVDYSKPSKERRLWVVDLKRQRVLFNTWVTHGSQSGVQNATSFSNQFGSHKSSLGVFVTDHNTYAGGHGTSLRVKGLEPGVNDHAEARSVVFHGAPYATGAVAQKYGQLGRSWGCLAVAPETIGPLINAIKDETVVVAYYPDRNWLSHSQWVG